MGEPNIIEKIKRFISGIAFKVFLWGSDMTQELYFELIYEQEKCRNDNPLE